VISGDKNNQKDIVTKRQEEKGGIQNAEDDKSEGTDMKKKREKMAEENVHAQLGKASSDIVAFQAEWFFEN
jgi:hypothetical protein